MDIASACLAGKKCRYDGQAREDEEIARLYREGKVVLVCPECQAKLPVPRCPSEIVGGDGADVLAGRARVMGEDGGDRTTEFIFGAQETLAVARESGAQRAYLKSKSPSCGAGQIYDGTFSKTLRSGSGVAAALLCQNGIKVIEV